MKASRVELEDCRALVIDSIPTSRSTMANMLRQIGVRSVAQAGQVADARRELENQVFDIVFCEDVFDNSPISGRELLDDLRRAQLLPHSTMFVMVTAERSHAKVTEAAESGLDSYLIKPHPATALEQRVLQAVYRKKMLRPIFDAIDAGDLASAARRCRERFDDRSEFGLYAARIGAELFLRVDDHSSARALYAAADSVQPLSWAKLGVARADVESRQFSAASRALDNLIAEQPGCAEAYDLLSRIQLEQAQLRAALDMQRSACKITPNTITRLQRQGTLAFFVGESDEASMALERSARLGLGSKTFDFQNLVLLALLHFDRRESKELARVIANVALAAERRPDNVRLQQMLRVVNALSSLHARRTDDGVHAVQAIAADIRNETFTHEAATHLLALLTRLRKTAPDLHESAHWVTEMAQRFCVSNASFALLLGAAAGDDAHAGLIADAQREVNGIAEDAVSRSVSGSSATAVEMLMQAGSRTLNVRLVDLAGAMLQRHAARISDAPALSRQIDALKIRCGGGLAVHAGMQRAAQNTAVPAPQTV